MRFNFCTWSPWETCLDTLPEVLTISRATDWAAQLTAAKLGIHMGTSGMADGSGWLW